jgi:hypothetical protein
MIVNKNFIFSGIWSLIGKGSCELVLVKGTVEVTNIYLALYFPS